MTSKSSLSLKTGRIDQKLKTRRKLLAATRDLMAEGKPVSVTAAAERAGISIATAYRYFSDPESLKLETVVEIDLGRGGDFIEDLTETYRTMEDPTERVIAAHRLMVDFVRRNEPAYRLFIAKGHEQVANAHGKKQLSPRGGRRMPMLELALAPAREALADRYRDAVLALAAVSGPEPFFVLKDLARLDDDEIDRISEQSLRMICAAYLG
jgi:AcrR family transcriptional regulator